LAAVQLAKEVSNQRGLPCADLAGEDDEAFALVERVLQRGVRALMPTAAVKEGRVRAELEGGCGKSEVGLEHGSVEAVAQAGEHRVRIPVRIEERIFGIEPA